MHNEYSSGPYDPDPFSALHDWNQHVVYDPALADTPPDTAHAQPCPEDPDNGTNHHDTEAPPSNGAARLPAELASLISSQREIIEKFKSINRILTTRQRRQERQLEVLNNDLVKNRIEARRMADIAEKAISDRKRLEKLTTMQHDLLIRYQLSSRGLTPID